MALHNPTEEQYKKIASKLIRKLCGRSGFDGAFDVDSDILEEIKLEMGKTAFEESIACLTLNGY